MSVEVCREFQRQKCTRQSDQCKYAHPGPNIVVENGRTPICRCERANCRYFHPPPHISWQLPSTLMGSGGKASAPVFSHGAPQPPNAHMPAHHTLPQYQPQIPVPGGIFVPYSANPIDPVSLAFQRPPLSHGNPHAGQVPRPHVLLTPSPFAVPHHPGFRPHAQQPPPPPQGGGASRPSRTLEVCRDFLRDKCGREDCRYAHPPSNVQLNYDGAVTLCMDFITGHCKRETCRYYHDVRQRSNPATSGRQHQVRGGQSQSDQPAKRRRTIPEDHTKDGWLPRVSELDVCDEEEEDLVGPSTRPDVRYSM